MQLNIFINNTKYIYKSCKSNWTKEEECSFINEIESVCQIQEIEAQEIVPIQRKGGNFCRDISAKLNPAYDNGRAVEEIRKKWTKLKLNANSKVDARFRETRKTGGGYNS